MRSTLDEIAADLDNLRTLVASIAPVNQVLTSHANSDVQKYLRIRRRFDHAAFVVALYASFEKFVEKLVGAYAQLIASCTSSYAALPSKLRDKHLRESGKILMAGRIGEGRYTGVTEQKLVKNLLDCLSGSEPYSLNEVAITSHEQNLRMPHVHELFYALDIKQVAELISKADPIVEWYKKTRNSAPIDKVPDLSIKNQLDDLVERRNQVAHRGGYTDELIGEVEMRDMVEFVHAYAHSLYHVAVTAYLKDYKVDGGLAVPLGPLSGRPYQGGFVVVVKRPTYRVHVQQAAFSLGEGKVARLGRVQEIQVNDVSVPSVEADSSATTIGLKFDFQCTKGRELYLLLQEDDKIWTPVARG